MKPRSQGKHHLRKRQKEVIEEMIRSAVPQGRGGNAPFAPAKASNFSDATTESIWRLLIFDDMGRDIIAPLLKVGDLRELGVTLYMHIDTERDPVPGAPAIYICAPTESNIERIAKDCADTLYEWVYVNFTAQIPRPKLESFAQRLCSANLPSISHIHVFDRTLSYVSLDEDLFSLLQPRSFFILNSQKVSDAEIGDHLDKIVLGLSHALFSQQALPIIARSKTALTEAVAQKLSDVLNTGIKDSILTPVSTSTYGRPLLLLVDRSSDIATALHHPFSYRGLLVDVCDMKLNKAWISPPTNLNSENGVPGHSAPSMTSPHGEIFELDPDRDDFYRLNGPLDFSVIFENIEASLKQYQEECAAVSVETSENPYEDGTDTSTMSKLLAIAPKLGERKRFLDSHFKLAKGIIDLVRKRQLDRFHGVELSIIQKEAMDSPEFAKLLAGAGKLSDRQRIFLIAYLLCTDTEEENFVKKQLSSFGNESFFALDYLKKLSSWAKGVGSPIHGHDNASQGFGWGFAQTIAKNIASTLGNRTEADLPLTQLVEALLNSDNSSNGNLRNQLLETVTGYDPRSKKEVQLSSMQFSQVIVFVVGGGCMAEYDDLKRWESRNQRKLVSYGCTSIVSGEEMLRDITSLGEESA